MINPRHPELPASPESYMAKSRAGCKQLRGHLPNESMAMSWLSYTGTCIRRPVILSTW